MKEIEQNCDWWIVIHQVARLFPKWLDNRRWWVCLAWLGLSCPSCQVHCSIRESGRLFCHFSTTKKLDFTIIIYKILNWTDCNFEQVSPKTIEPGLTTDKRSVGNQSHPETQTDRFTWSNKRFIRSWIFLPQKAGRDQYSFGSLLADNLLCGLRKC